jgi:hypothetical protein
LHRWGSEGNITIIDTLFSNFRLIRPHESLVPFGIYLYGLAAFDINIK